MKSMLSGVLVRGMALLWACLALSVAHADDLQTKVLGNWLTAPKDGIIQVSVASDGTLQGKIVGGDSPGKLDSKNPDQAKRTAVLRGQVIMQGLKYEGEGKWSGGTIYDPNSGSTYKCKIELRTDGTLKVRGFIGFSLLGKTQEWTRYTGTSMDLPKAK